MAVKHGSKRVNADGTPWAKSGRPAVGIAPPPAVPARVDDRDVAAQPYVDILRQRGKGEWFNEGEKRAVLELCAIYDGDTRTVAKLAGCDRRQIIKIKHGDPDEYVERRTAWKKAMAVEMSDVATLAADRVRDTIHQASALQAATVMGIAVQRGMELAGESVAMGPMTRGGVTLHVSAEALEQLRGRGTGLLDRLGGVVFDQEPFSPTDSKADGVRSPTDERLNMNLTDS